MPCTIKKPSLDHCPASESGRNIHCAIWQHCLMLSFFCVFFSFFLVSFLVGGSWNGFVIWLCGHNTSASYSSFWSTYLYNHLSDDSLSCTPLYSEHSQYRKYSANTWSISSLQLGSAMWIILENWQDKGM